MNRSRRVALVGLALALSLAVSGCSFGDTVDASEVSVAVEEPVVLRIGHTSSMTSDPLTVQPLDAASVVLADALTDSLTELAPDGIVQPALASSWESADGVTWRFALAERRWPDGQPITSADVVASLTRVLSSASSSLHGARLATVIADGGVAADGDRAVLITARGPDHEVPAVLAAVPYGVLRAADLQAAGALGGGMGGEGSEGSPAGGVPALDLLGTGLSTSGPFTVGVVTREAPIVSLKRSSFPDDRAETPMVAGTATSPTTLEFVRYSSTAMVLDAFERGEIDLAELDAEATPSNGAPVVEVEGAVIYAAVGSQRSLADAAVRSGVVAAVAGHASWSPDDIVPGEFVACADCAAEGTAGASGGSVHLVVGPGTRLGRTGTVLAERLGAAGVTVDRTDLTRETMAAALDGTADVTVFVVPGLVTSIDVVLGSLFGAAGKENLSGFTSPDFDAALAAARAVPEAAARYDAYSALLRRLAEETPGIPLESVSTRWAVGERVSGVVPWAGHLFTHDVVSVTP